MKIIINFEWIYPLFRKFVWRYVFFCQKAAIFFVFFYGSTVFALQCPDPQTTSLKNGQVPAPWVLPSYSHPLSSRPSAFIQAYIFTGSTPGVLCSYSNSSGNYSIFWSTTVQTPVNPVWILSFDGYFCVQSINSCTFAV